MEKTILYSKKSSSLTNNLELYESCQHEHCKHLLAHVKFLSNALTCKVLKEQHSAHQNILRPKSQNVPSISVVQPQFTKAIEEEIEQIKKNYLKLKKQLNQVETENDELFQENQQLKKNIQRLNDQINKFSLELSLSRSPIQTKNSFYQPSTTHGNSCEIQSKENEYVPVYPRSVDLGINNAILPVDFTKQNHRFQNCNNCAQRTEFFQRYEKLIKENASLGYKMNEKQEIMKQFQKRVKKLQYENMQLKKIIKLRNQIQVQRHKTINGLKHVIDEMMA